ncbi:hypothetical protein I4U23_018442 [Adineta vaga]|nr:hypothetical protein I4U23_018442 [Adineta vaga]
MPTLDNNESPPKRRKIEANDAKFPLNNLFEATALQQIRKRTFSHWPHKHIPSQAQMVEAGFFNCNVGDRVICIYCNLICQQWTPETDNPTEVHKTLSPNCVYVKTKLLRRDEGPLLIVNENGTVTASANGSATSTSADQFRCNEFVHTAACNAAFAELPKRAASFVTWPTDNLPSVDDLVRAGFFFTGIKTVVTCFYCNGSLQNWGPNDNPTIEHARWFPHCAYARQLCGDELYRKIQESKRAQQERAKANETRDRAGPMNTTSSNSASNSRLLLIPDESTLSRLVAARLDLPISQTLLGEFKLSIIKRCWEDQLRLKHDDFVSDSDLRMACTILQKQISCIDGKKENIVVPCIKMRKLREEAEKERADAKAREQLAMNPVVPVPAPSIGPIASDDTNVEMRTPEQTTTKNATPQANITSKQDETNVPKSVTSDTNQQKEKEDISQRMHVFYA